VVPLLLNENHLVDQTIFFAKKQGNYFFHKASMIHTQRDESTKRCVGQMSVVQIVLGQMTRGQFFQTVNNTRTKRQVNKTLQMPVGKRKGSNTLAYFRQSVSEQIKFLLYLFQERWSMSLRLLGPNGIKLFYIHNSQMFLIS